MKRDLTSGAPFWAQIVDALTLHIEHHSGGNLYMLHS